VKLDAACANVTRIMSTSVLKEKVDRRDQARAEFAKLIENVCGRGFFGTASVLVNVQDGHIQYTKVNVERMIR